MKIKNLFEKLERTGESKGAVLGWGRGMGHKGHMFLASSVITHASDLDADPYFVVSRTVGKDDPITPEEKLEIYKKVFPEKGHIFHTATEEMPDLTKVLAKLQELGYDSVTVVVGADQKKALSYVLNYNGKADKQGNVPFSFKELNVISRQETSDPSREEEGPRATPMRDILKDPVASEDEKFAAWRAAMNPELSDEEVRDLMNKASQRMSDFDPKKKGKVAESVGPAEFTKTVLTEVRSIIREMRNDPYIRVLIENAEQDKKSTLKESDNQEEDYYYVVRHQTDKDIELEMPAKMWTGLKPKHATYEEAKAAYEQLKNKNPREKFTVTRHPRTSYIGGSPSQAFPEGVAEGAKKPVPVVGPEAQKKKAKVKTAPPKTELEKHSKLATKLEEDVDFQFDIKLVKMLKGRGYKGPVKLEQLGMKWIEAIGDIVDIDDGIMVKGRDPEYDGWVAYVYEMGQYAYGAEQGYQTGDAKSVERNTREQGVAEGSLEEVSQQTLQSYRKKASAQKRAADDVVSGDADDETWKKNVSLSAKRRQGIDAANKRLGVAEGMAPNKRARLDDLIDQYRAATDPEAYYGLDGEYGDPDEIIAQIRQEFGDNVATKVDAGADKMHFGREHRSFSHDPYDWKKSPRVTRSGKINKQDSDAMKRSIKSNLGVAEGEQRMSRAAKGNEKYGKDGMKALAKAGREGASEKQLDAIRDKHDNYNEGWSQKYKSSINCSHPKGFSQKAHCAGKKKNNESIETHVMQKVCEDCGMCETHGDLNEIKKGQKDSNGFTKCWSGYHAAGTKKSATTGKSVRNCVPNESIEEGKIKINIKHPPESAQEKLYKKHQELRKKSGLPDPSEYKKRAAEKQKEIDDMKEAKESEPPKPRNFVAKNAKTAGAGAHKDKKKQEKQGDVKHKAKAIPMDESRWGPARKKYSGI